MQCLCGLTQVNILSAFVWAALTEKRKLVSKRLSRYVLCDLYSTQAVLGDELSYLMSLFQEYSSF